MDVLEREVGAERRRWRERERERRPPLAALLPAPPASLPALCEAGRGWMARLQGQRGCRGSQAWRNVRTGAANDRQADAFRTRLVLKMAEGWWPGGQCVHLHVWFAAEMGAAPEGEGKNGCRIGHREKNEMRGGDRSFEVRVLGLLLSIGS